MIKEIIKYAPFLGGLAEKINEIIVAIRPFENISGDKYITVSRSKTNVVFSASALLLSLITRSTNHPFKIIPVQGVAKVVIVPGDVENIIPKIGSDFLNDSTAPQLSVVTGPVFLECTMDSGSTFTEAEIKNTSSLPANTTTKRYRQIGTVSVSGTSVTVTAQTVKTSVSHKLCGSLSTWGQA